MVGLVIMTQNFQQFGVPSEKFGYNVKNIQILKARSLNVIMRNWAFVTSQYGPIVE